MQRNAWLYGARVHEAIACAFSKDIKYGEEPRIYTKAEREENEQKHFNSLMERWANNG